MGWGRVAVVGGRGRAGGAGRSRNDRRGSSRSPVPTGSPREVLGGRRWAVGLGGASPGPVPSVTGPLRGGPWSACAPLLMSLSLCALCPALLVPGETSRRVPGLAVVNGFCTPSGSRGLLAASRRSTPTLGGRLGRPGSLRRVRPRCFSPARPLARPGWAGQHHPTSSSPHRRRCGCHRLVEELDNPNARRDDFVWSATRPAAQLDPGHPDRRAHRRWGARDDPRLSRDTQISYAVP